MGIIWRYPCGSCNEHVEDCKCEPGQTVVLVEENELLDIGWQVEQQNIKELEMELSKTDNEGEF